MNGKSIDSIDQKKTIICWILSFFVWIVPNLSTLIEEVRQLPAYVMDGPYQVVASCRRVLEFGQIPGEDFVVFHGNGVVWLHLPLYAMLPKTPEGAFICYYVAGAFVLLGGYISFLLYSGVKPSVAIPLSAATIGVGLLAPMPLRYLFLPMHNLVSTRIGLALMLLAGIGWFLERKNTTALWRKLLPAGLLAGAGLALFRDIGMYVLLATIAGLTITSLVDGRKRFLPVMMVKSISLAFGVVAGWFVSHAVASGGAFVEEAKLSFRTLPAIQGWYWVDGAPMTGLYGLGISELIGFFRWAILAAVVSTGILISGSLMHARLGRLTLLLLPLFVFGLLGLVPETGYLSFHYIAPVVHSAIIMALVFACISYEKVLAGSHLIKNLRHYLPTFFVAATIALSVVVILASRVRKEWYQDGLYPDADTAATRGAGPSLVDAAAPDRIPELIDWLQQLGVNQGNVWSMHTGPVDQAFHQKPPGAWDSIYFALGDEDEKRYLRAYREAAPDWVLMVDSRYRPGRWQRQWYFTREVMASSEPVASGAGWSIWRRKGPMISPQTKEMAPLEMTREKNGFCINLPESIDGRPRLIELTLNYRVKFSGLSSVMAPAGKLIGVATDGVPHGVSLPCRSGTMNSIVLPILTTGDGKKTFSVAWHGWGGAPDFEHLHVNAVSVINIPENILQDLLAK